MAVNKDNVEGNWIRIKKDIQKSWGKLTDSDLDKTDGDLNNLGKLIHKVYDEPKAEAIHKLEVICKRYESKVEIEKSENEGMPIVHPK